MKKEDIIKEINGLNIFRDNSTKLKKHIIKIINDDLGDPSGYNEVLLNNYLNKLKNSIDLYYQNIDLLKGYSKLEEDNEFYFNIMDKYAGGNMFFHEYLSDKIVKIKDHHDVLKYAKSFVRSYKSLLNEESLEKFKYIKEKTVNRKTIEESLSKIAAFRSPDDLNEALDKIIDNIALKKEDIINKIEENGLNAEVVFNEGNKLIVKIEDYEASNELGSSQWCISYNEGYYEEYLNYDTYKLAELAGDAEDACTVTDDNYYDTIETYMDGNHFFVWNFNKSPDNPESLFAFTMKPNGEITDAHDKNDKSIFSSRGLNLLLDDAINKSIKDTVLYNQEQLEKYNTRKTDICNILDNPVHLIHNFPYPIIGYYKTLSQFTTEDIKDYIIESDIKSLKIPSSLINKTEDNYNKFSYIKKSDIVKSLIWFGDFIKEMKNWEDVIEEYNKEQDEDEDWEDLYIDEENNNKDIKFEIYYDNKEEVIKNDFLYKVINDMTEAERFLLFKEKAVQQLIIDRNKNQKVSSQDEYHLMLAENFDFIKTLDGFDYLNKETMENLAKKIKQKKLKLKINNFSNLNNKDSEFVAEAMNEDKNVLELVKFDSIDTVINLIDNDVILKRINEKTLSLMCSKIEKDLEIKVVFDKQLITKLESNNLEEKGLGLVINKMYRTGLITKKFIDNIKIEQMPNRVKEDYPGEYSSLKEYMLSGKTIYSKKKQMKLF